MPSTRAELSLSGGHDCFEESLASKPFLFVVGDERKEFHIHKDLIGQLSPALNALVNGRMKEAREGRVEWPDLQVETFVQFAKYAYSRDYTEAEPEMLPRPPSAQPPKTAEVTEQQQSSQTSQTQMIDLTDQTDNDGSGAEEDDPEDDQGSSSLDEDSSDELLEDDEDEEEELEDDDEEGMYDDEEEDDDVDGDTNAPRPEFDRHQIQDSIRSPAEVPSLLSKRKNPISRDLKALPYSISTYITDWQGYMSELFHLQEFAFGANISNQRPSNKRRLLNSGQTRFASSANLKYDAMKRFCGLIGYLRNDHWSPRPNEDPYENYEPVFMSHVRLYALAEKYGVEGLKKLTLHRLHVTLTQFQIFPERVGDVVCIVPVIYDYTVPDDVARKMIVQFFCCVAEHVRENSDFRNALRSVGEFADDLFQQMTSRLM